MNPRLKFSIQLVISIGIIVFLLRIINPNRVITLLKDINLWFFILLLLLVTFDRIFMSYKWYLLMKAKGIKVSIRDAIRVYYIGTFASFFLPTTVGGDLVRVYKLHSESQEGAKVLSSVIIERMLGFIASGLVAVFGVMFLIYMLELNVWYFFWFALFVFIFFVILFLLSFSIHRVVGKNVKDWMKRFSVFLKIKKIYAIYTEYKNRKILLFIFILLSCLEQLAAVIGNYLASIALGLSIPFVYFLAIIPVVQLFNRLPISFNGIGVNEGLMVYFFSLLHLQKTDAFTIGLLGHIAILLSVVPAIIYLSSKYLYRRL